MSPFSVRLDVGLRRASPFLPSPRFGVAGAPKPTYLLEKPIIKWYFAFI
jgi:hypothetical protein